jgi:hypothetical protein
MSNHGQCLALVGVVLMTAIPVDAKDFKGRTNRPDTACLSLDTVRQADKALGEKRYAESHNLLTGTLCPRVQGGTVVRGPIERETLTHHDGSRTEFVRVRLPDGRKVWMIGSNIDQDGR